MIVHPRPSFLSMGLLLAFMSCSGSDGSDNQPRQTVPLDAALRWYGNNAQRLNDFMAQYGQAGAGYDAKKRPVAVFDWDNTTIKNDIGDATFFYMINQDKILQPPGRNWRLTSPFLTADAVSALSAACDAVADPGQPLKTSQNTACADEIFSIYDTSKTASGKSAFGGSFNHRRLEPSYAWGVQLSAGYTAAEVHAFTEAAMALNFGNPIGATQSVGSHTGLAGYVRVYDQMKDLIAKMQTNGFDVWVCSASPQSVVETIASRVNIAPDHVIGVRLLTDGNGRLTYNLQGCGDVPDGTNDGAGHFTGNGVITYIDGKRCWINKVIWGDNSAAALEKTADVGKRQLFSAGDADTDVTFVRDASALKLVINRNKAELMCNGYGNFDGNYLINPMFISPKAQLAAGYPCATTACSDEDGSRIPCMNEASPPVAIGNQQDSVFGQ